VQTASANTRRIVPVAARVNGVNVALSTEYRDKFSTDAWIWIYTDMTAGVCNRIILDFLCNDPRNSKQNTPLRASQNSGK
jgi:hypothetical protein